MYIAKKQTNTKRFANIFNFQMHSHRQGIEEALTTTKGQLEKLHTDIGRTLEKISSREKYLNNQLEAPLADFKRLSDNLAAAREQYKSVSGGKSLLRY